MRSGVGRRGSSFCRLKTAERAGTGPSGRERPEAYPDGCSPSPLSS